MRESKAEYLTRLMLHGSPRAKLLKLADRISNMTALGFVHDVRFVRRFVAETRQFVLPYAAAINPDMHRELSHLIENREQLLAALRSRARPARARWLARLRSSPLAPSPAPASSSSP